MIPRGPMLLGLPVLFLVFSCQTKKPDQKLEDPIAEETAFALEPQIDAEFYATHPRRALSDAKNHIHVEDYDQAIAVLEAFQGKKPRFEARRLFQLARAHRAKEDFATAISYNNQAISTFPNLFSAYYNNACFYLTQDEPDVEQAQYYLKQMHQQIGDRSDRLAYYRRMMRTDIDFDEVREESWYDKTLLAYTEEYSEQAYESIMPASGSDELDYDETEYDSATDYDPDSGYDYDYDNEPDTDTETDYEDDETIDDFELDGPDDDGDLYDQDEEFNPTLTSMR